MFCGVVWCVVFCGVMFFGVIFCVVFSADEDCYSGKRREVSRPFHHHQPVASKETAVTRVSKSCPAPTAADRLSPPPPPLCP